MIAATVNAPRRSVGAKGAVVSKDIFNKGTKLGILQKRGGRDESQILRDFLRAKMAEDPQGVYDVELTEVSVNRTIKASKVACQCCAST